MSLRIALVGYGQMGKAIEQVALQKGHQVVARIRRENAADLSSLSPSVADVAIEFTEPSAATGNFDTLINTKVPVVTGTTGWLDQLETVRQQVEASGTAFMWAANYSPGMNILFALNEKISRMMNHFPEYDVFLNEMHHRHKKDAPGGSARYLAEQTLRNLDRKNKIAPADLSGRTIATDELSLTCVRAGEIPGIHEVTYASGVDKITLRHEAFSRRGFAEGAVLAAEWLQGKCGFYSFSDLFENL